MPADTDQDELLRDVDPMLRFAGWVPAMYADGAAFSLMTLSTVDEDGYPEGRTVLLSGYNEAGFCFHTDAQSRKVGQLRADPRACLTLVWPEVARQVVIQGAVEVLDDDAARDGYLARPRYLQLLAWINSTDNAQLPHAARAAAFAEFDAANPTLIPPPSWIGFRLVPKRIVFWQGAQDASSVRLEYRRTEDGWHTALLPG